MLRLSNKEGYLGQLIETESLDKVAFNVKQFEKI